MRDTLSRVWRSLPWLVVGMLAGPPLVVAQSPADRDARISAVRTQLRAGEYEAAEAASRQLLRERSQDETEDPAGYARILDLLVEILRRDRATEEETQALAERAVELKRTALGPEDPEVAISLKNLGSVHQLAGDLDRAMPFYEQAAAIQSARQGPDSLDLAMTLVNMGGIRKDQSRLDEAKTFYERALEIRTKRLDPFDPDLAKVLSALAELDRLNGDYIAARPRIERAIEIQRRAYPPTHPRLAFYLDVYGNVLTELKDYEEARRSFEAAITNAEARGKADDPEVANYLHNLANVLAAQAKVNEDARKRERAESLLRRARSILVASYGADSADAADVLTALGYLMLEQEERLAAAKALFEQAIPIQEAERGADDATVAASLNGLATVFFEQRDYIRAMGIYERVIEVDRAIYGESHPELATDWINLGRCKLAMGDKLGALAVALQAEEIAREHVRATAVTLSERQALGYAAGRIRGLDVLIEVASRGLGAADLERVWDALVRSRSLVLDEMSARRQLSAEAEEAPAIAAQRRRLDEASASLAKLALGSGGSQPQATSKAILDDARRARDRAEEDLAAASLAYRAHRERGRTGVQSVSEALPPHAALVAYVRYERADLARFPSGFVSHYAALVLRPGGTPGRVVDLGPAEGIETSVARWRERVLSLSEEPQYRRAAEALRRAVWDPVTADLEGAQTIFVVPDGALNLVNFYALPAGSSSYLVESGPALHHLSAERDLGRESTGAPRNGGLLALGGLAYDREGGAPAGNASIGLRAAAGCGEFASIRWSPLAGTREEAEAIAALWREAARAAEVGAGGDSGARGAAVLLLGPAGTEAALRRAASGNRVLHLATHGFFLGAACANGGIGTRGVGGLATSARATPELSAEERGLFYSGLVLSGGNGASTAASGADDGVLTAAEVALLNLQGVEWAVLSACETGLGTIQSGEGVLGLRRAFQISGVGTVVMSLWSVEDESALRWMRALYEARLQRGRTTVESVREATLAALQLRRKKGESLNPFFWAGFVAAGDWR